MVKKYGKIQTNGLDLWGHELKVAKFLADSGFDIVFLKPINRNNIQTPDIKMCGKNWEIKCPRTAKISGIEQNLKRASKQSENIIICSIRIKNIHDKSIERFLKAKLNQQKTIKSLIFINRYGKVIDICK